MTLQRPSAAAMPARTTIRADCGISCSMTPATTAPPPQRPARSSVAAAWQATSEAEQAVSMAAEGPEKPKAKEMRPGATAAEAAVKEKGPICRYRSQQVRQGH